MKMKMDISYVNSVTFFDGFQNPNPTPFIGEVTVTPAAAATGSDGQTTGTTHTHKVGPRF